MKHSPPSLEGLALPPGVRPSPGAATQLRPLIQYCCVPVELSALLRSETGALRLFVAALLLVSSAGSSFSATHYVDVNSTNATSPYSNWSTAAISIQDAVDAALTGDEILVTNGMYFGSGGPNGYVVQVTNRIILRSVNGPESTVIMPDGIWNIGCVYLIGGASLSGFTLSGGNAPAGVGGGAYGGTLNNCTLTGNSAYYYGGGAYSCTLNNCTLTGNSVDASSVGSDGTDVGGGGAAYCTLNNCTITGNWARPYWYSRCLYWCESGGQPWCCRTISVQSSAYGGGAYFCTLNNCIIYSNTDNSDGGNYYSGPLNHCCTMPLPYGTGNFTNAPLFVSSNGWTNLRLQSNSPCINAGNNSYLTNSDFTNCFDLDGNPRVAGGTVDIGAYEFQAPASGISYAWLQQYALTISATTDLADPDADGVDNYHEWLAGTDPLNRFSSPAQLAVFASGTNLVVTWSTNAVGFTLQSAADLGPQALWTTNAPGPVVIGGQNIVTNPASGQRQFFRLTQ